MKQSIVERRIMWGDLDSLGIVFYPRYYEWLDASGHLFFESLGLGLDTLWQRRQIQFGLIETGCQYASPGRYHQTVRIATQLDALTSKTLTLKSTFHDVADDRLLLTGIEKRICMDVSNPYRIRAVDIPSDVYDVLHQAMA